MPRVRLRWNDGIEQEFAAIGPTLAVSLALPDGKGGVVSFSLVNDPDPPDPGFDRTAEGRVVKCLTIVDDATTEAVAIVPARALGGVPVTRVFDRLADERGLPRILRSACYEQVVKALGAVGSSNRGTDTGSGSVEPAHRASSGLIPEERRVPGGSTSSCLRREELRTTVGMASSPVGAGASGFYAAIDSSLHTWSASNAVRFLTTANA